MASIRSAVMVSPGELEVRELPRTRSGRRSGYYHPQFTSLRPLPFLPAHATPSDVHHGGLDRIGNGIEITGSEGSMKVVIEP